MQTNKGISQGLVPVDFSEDLSAELRKLNSEMRLMNILQVLADSPANGTATLDAADVSDIRHLMLVLADLFSTSLPPVEDNPFDMMLLAARDQHLSRLLKERGLARLFRLVTLQVKTYDELTKQFVLLPAFMLEKNPDTGLNFKNQEEFLGWWCSKAHVPRSLVFMRMATYARLLSLGMSLEEAFEVVLKKPYAAREVMNELATWQRSDMVDVKPDVAIRLVRQMLPDQVQVVEELTAALEQAETPAEADQIKGDLLEIVKPAIRQVVEQVADHESKRDAMDWVRHDIASKPEIKYWWDPEHRWVVVEYIRKAKDVKGNQYVAEVVKIPMFSETELPSDVLADLASRLSFKNRDLEF